MSLFENILQYQRRYRSASHLLFWLAVFFISIASSKYYDKNEFTIGFALIGDGLYLIPQIIAAYFLTYWIVPGFFNSRLYTLSILGFLAGSYFICVLSRFLIVRVAEPLAGVAPKASETNAEILTDMPKLVYVYFFHIFALAFFFLFIKGLKGQFDIRQHTLRLEKEKAEAELKLLKTQLHPHFLFNTLNNIYALSLTNSPATSASIGRLADILDHILYRSNSPMAPLSDEIVLLNNYITLEQLRYDDRLQVHFNSRIGRDWEVPPLILLSLVENAFKHGVGEDPGNPVIRIDLDAGEDSFQFTISNSCMSRPVTDSRDKIGLPNLKKQLELAYPGRHTLMIDHGERIFRVDLAIHLKKGSL